VWSEENLTEVKRKLEALANGETVALGEFGDAGTTTDADEQADILRHVKIPPD
jgi:hypothetical protein